MNRKLQYFDEVLREHLKTAGVRDVFWSLNSPNPPADARTLSAPRLVLLLNGKADYVLNDGKNCRRKNLQKGDALFIVANGWFLPVFDSEREVFMARLFPEGIFFSHYHYRPPGPFEDSLFHEFFQRVRPLDELLRELTTLVQQMARTEPMSEAAPSLISALSTLILEYLSLPVPKRAGKGRSNAMYYLVRNYVEENYRSPLNRNDVAERLAMHPDRISQLFAEYHNEGFTSYLNRLRLNEARRLLENFELSVTEAAFRSGFSSANYFVKLFRNRFSTTPGRYRLSLDRFHFRHS